MVIATGTVRHGAIEIKATDLPEGATVTVLAAEGDETFELNAEQEARLVTAVEEADKGAFVPASQLLADLRHSRNLSKSFSRGPQPRP